MSRPFPSGIVVLRLRLPCRAVCQLRIGIKARHELIGPAGQTAHYNAQQSPTAGVKRAQYLLIIYSSSLSVPLCPSLIHSLAFAFTLFLLFFVGTSLLFFSLLFLDFFLFLTFFFYCPLFFLSSLYSFFLLYSHFLLFSLPCFSLFFSLFLCFISFSPHTFSSSMLSFYLALSFPPVLLLLTFSSFFFFSSSLHSSLYSQYPPPQALSLSS